MCWGKCLIFQAKKFEIERYTFMILMIWSEKYYLTSILNNIIQSMNAPLILLFCTLLTRPIQANSSVSLCFLHWSAMQHAVGFSPISALKRTAEITTEQMNQLIGFISASLTGAQGLSLYLQFQLHHISVLSLCCFSDPRCPRHWLWVLWNR